MQHVSALRSLLTAARNVQFTRSALVFPNEPMLALLNAHQSSSAHLNSVDLFACFTAAGTNAPHYCSRLLRCAERFNGAAVICDQLVWHLMGCGNAVPDSSFRLIAECGRGVLLYCLGRLRFHLKRNHLARMYPACRPVPVNLNMLKGAATAAVASASDLFLMLQIEHPANKQVATAMQQPHVLQGLEVFGRMWEGGIAMQQKIQLIHSMCFLVCFFLMKHRARNSNRVALSALCTIRKRLRILADLAADQNWIADESSIVKAGESLIFLEMAAAYLPVHTYTHPAVLSLIYQNIILQIQICSIIDPAASSHTHTHTEQKARAQYRLIQVAAQMTPWERARICGCIDCVNLAGPSETAFMQANVRPCSACKRKLFCHSMQCATYRRHLEFECTGAAAT